MTWPGEEGNRGQEGTSRGEGLLVIKCEIFALRGAITHTHLWPGGADRRAGPDVCRDILGPRG